MYDEASVSRVPSILIVHPDRKTQRVVQRILGVTGYGIDIADDLDQGTRLLANTSPIGVSSSAVRCAWSPSGRPRQRWSKRA